MFPVAGRIRLTRLDNRDVFLFFARGNVPVIAVGLKNAQWTALAILAVTLPALVALVKKGRRGYGESASS